MMLNKLEVVVAGKLAVKGHELSSGWCGCFGVCSIGGFGGEISWVLMVGLFWFL